jgi:hypothetical protein
VDEEVVLRMRVGEWPSEHDNLECRGVHFDHDEDSSNPRPGRSTKIDLRSSKPAGRAMDGAMLHLQEFEGDAE